jgi:large conductance mechanosensitive channel
MQDAKPEVLNEVGEVIKPAVNEVTLNYGNFLQQTFDFLIIAMSIFVVIRLITKVAEMTKKKEAEVKAAEPEPAPAPEPEPTKEELLLAEIRDILKDKK